MEREREGERKVLESTSFLSLTSVMMRFPAAAVNSSASTDVLEVEADSCSLIIMKVQHLIESCLTFYLDQDECAKTLHKHAQIDPIITKTVWKELEMANKDFFEEYYCERVSRKNAHFDRAVEDTAMGLSRQSLEDISNKVKERS